MLKEFKEFLSRGNIIDLAVAVIIGSAFGKIVTSLVNDVIMPPIGLLLGKVDFSNLFITLSGHHYETLSAAKKAGAPTINYGVFINTVVNFFIIALLIFLLLKTINKLKRDEPQTIDQKTCPYCQSSISIKATRCPNCTSSLDHENDDAPHPST